MHQDQDPRMSAATGELVSDEELTALALAADPDAPIEADAVPLAQYLGDHAGLLPDWYMPVPDGPDGKALAHPGGAGHRGRLRDHRGLRPVQHLRAARPGLSRTLQKSS